MQNHELLKCSYTVLRKLPCAFFCTKVRPIQIRSWHAHHFATWQGKCEARWKVKWKVKWKVMECQFQAIFFDKTNKINNLSNIFVRHIFCKCGKKWKARIGKKCAKKNPLSRAYGGKCNQPPCATRRTCSSSPLAICSGV